LAVRVEKAAAKIGIAVQLAVGTGEQVVHVDVEGVVLRGPGERDSKDVAAALDDDFRLDHGLKVGSAASAHSTCLDRRGSGAGGARRGGPRRGPPRETAR